MIRFKTFLLLTIAMLACTAMAACGNHKRRYKPGISAITTLTLDIPHTDHIVEPNDIDTYIVELLAGNTYRITTFNLSAGMDTVLRLFDESGTLLAEHDNVSEIDLSSFIEIDILQDGVYTIIVSHKDPEAFRGMYDILVELVGVTPDDGGSGDGGSGDGGSDGGSDSGNCPDGHGSDDHDCRIDK